MINSLLGIFKYIVELAMAYTAAGCSIHFKPVFKI